MIPFSIKGNCDIYLLHSKHSHREVLTLSYYLNTTLTWWHVSYIYLFLLGYKIMYDVILNLVILLCTHNFTIWVNSVSVTINMCIVFIYNSVKMFFLVVNLFAKGRKLFPLLNREDTRWVLKEIPWCFYYQGKYSGISHPQ